MQKRIFLKALMASTMFAGLGLPAFADSAFDGPTSGVTVAEPLNLQGWQSVDEMNRAVSGYVTAPTLVIEEGLKAMGDSNPFDPQNGDREAYAKIWGKM
jgi:ribose transport system substrate-binding protein